MALISGTAVPETLNGTDEPDTIYGFDGDDTLNGFGGNDYLDGGRGLDTLSGGTGDDIYIVNTPLDGSPDVVKENANEGIDEVRTNLAEYHLTANVENVTGNRPESQLLFGNALGNRMVGGLASDSLHGAFGNDVLYGGDGLDQLYGDQGDDIYVVDGNDIVYEFFQEQYGPAANGYDTVLASASYKLRDDAYVEVLATVDAAAFHPINLTGNGFQNLIYGNAGANILTSGARSGTGDHLSGYGGNDIYFVNENDLVFETAGNGNDTVIVIPYAGNATYALRADAHVETLGTNNAQGTELINLTGNAFQNLIYGNDGRNILTSNGGGDHLNGNGGDDIYVVTAGDLVFESAGDGNDTVNANSNYILNSGSHVETLGTVDASATTAINLTGNELQNLIYGNAGNNVLTGGGGGDHLHGGAGNDILVEGAGFDLLFGGAGSDTFVFQTQSGGLAAIYDFASGTDKIDLSAIDSNSAEAGNNAFTYIGGNAFSGKAGELRVQMDGTTANVFGDLNGDSVADFQVVVYNTAPPVVGDFVL